MKRKNFIKIFSLAGIGLAAISGGAFLVTPDRNKIAAEFIIKSLNYLKLDKAGVQKFTADYFGEGKPGVLDNLRWKYYLVSGKDVSNSTNMYELVRLYLLSSDFFKNGMDKNKVVRYETLFNPYKGVASNPFSGLGKRS